MQSRAPPSVIEFVRKLELMIGFFFSDAMDLCFLIRIVFLEIMRLLHVFLCNLTEYLLTDSSDNAPILI